MKYNTIFFDLDDTLVDTAKNSEEALEDLYIDYKLDKHFATFQDFWNRFHSVNQNLWDLYAHNKISKETLKSERFMRALDGRVDMTSAQSFNINENFLSRVNTKKNAIEGVEDILDYLLPKYQLYILSNGFEEVQDHKMRNANLKPYFKKVILSDHIGINKPDPQLFTYALNEAKASSGNTIMIGDNLKTDIIGAKNSNIDQVWFNPANQPDEYNVRPTFTIQGLSELRNIL